MPDRSGQDPEVVRNRSASGGVNTFSFPLDLQDDQVVDLTNGIAPTPGVREVRSGTSIVATGVTFGPILAMSEFMAGGFTAELLVISPGATYPASGHLKLWKWDGVATTLSLIGTLTGFTSATMPVDIVPGLDLNIGSTPAVVRINTKQPVDHNYVYAGSALTLISGPEKQPTTGMFPMTVVLNRAFGGGRQGNSRGRLFYSDVASFNYTGWGGVQNFGLGGGNRQEIVAIKPFRNQDVVVFMTDRTEVMSIDGDPIKSAVSFGDWRRGVIDTRIGCGARSTVRTIGEDLFFLDQYANVRSLARTITDNSQGSKSLPISAPIQSWIDRVNPAAIEASVAESYDRYYAIALPIDLATFPSHTFLFDTINKAWYGPQIGNFSTVNAMAVATLNGASDTADRNPTLYLGGSATAQGEVRRAFRGTADDGAAILYQETSKRYDYGGIEVKKNPLRHRVYTVASVGATLAVEARAGGADWKNIGFLDMTGNAPQLPIALPFSLGGQGVVEGVFAIEDIMEKATDLQFRMTCTASQAMQILGHTTQVHIDNIDWTPRS